VLPLGTFLPRRRRGVACSSAAAAAAKTLDHDGEIALANRR
jgi:hypothetical protein